MREESRQKFLSFLRYFHDRRVLISEWCAIIAIALSVFVSALSLSIHGMSWAVKFSLFPVLMAAAALSVANAAKAKKKKLFAILALWISLGGVFISHLQYQRLMIGMQTEGHIIQDQQK